MNNEMDNRYESALEVIERDPSKIRGYKFDKSLQLFAVEVNPESIQYIDNPSEEVQIAAVYGNGLAIEFIDNPNEEVQMIAVGQDGLAIEFIENPSYEVQLEAVNQDGRALQYIKNPGQEVIDAANAQIVLRKLKYGR